MEDEAPESEKGDEDDPEVAVSVEPQVEACEDSQIIPESQVPDGFNPELEESQYS